MQTIILTVSIVALTVLFMQFSGDPSRFQLKRTFDIASFLRTSIERAKQDKTIDNFGNLDVVARNSWFLTYRGFYQSDVERVATVIAIKNGFSKAYVEFDSGFTTFRFKRLNS